ncbi:MAG: hypothetical protein QM710_02390 [Flavobacterium sp.]
MRKLILMAMLLPLTCAAQSDFQNVIKGGEILLNGLTIFKTAKPETKSGSGEIESVCVKNKLADKITFRIVGKNKEGDEIAKELIVQKEGRECFFALPKGIYTYEVVLPNKDIYKKGEYKFEEEVVITIKDN